MAGYNERTVDELLARLDPSLDARTFAFVSVPRSASTKSGSPLDGVVSVASIEEPEGITYVVAYDAAYRAGLNPAFRCRRLDLGSDTPLEGVGFLARILSELASLGIPVNPIAGFHRDILFVPVQHADDALEALRRLAQTARQKRAGLS